MPTKAFFFNVCPLSRKQRPCFFTLPSTIAIAIVIVIVIVLFHHYRYCYFYSLLFFSSFLRASEAAVSDFCLFLLSAQQINNTSLSS